MRLLTKLIIVFSIIIFTLNNSFSQKVEFEQSYNYENNGDYNKAISILKEKYDEKSYALNLRLGWLTYMSGLFTESIAYYSKAIELMPYSIEARMGYIYPTSALGHWEQVINMYKEILSIDSNNLTAHYKLGLIYYGREDYKTSYMHFEKCVNSYPFTYDYLIYFAWINYKLGKVREAKYLFIQVLLSNPNDSSALEGLSLIK